MHSTDLTPVPTVDNGAQGSDVAVPSAPAMDWAGALAMTGSVLILGLGASGLAMARWCARHGAQVTVADTRAAPPQLSTLQRLSLIHI